MRSLDRALGFWLGCIAATGTVVNSAGDQVLHCLPATAVRDMVTVTPAAEFNTNAGEMRADPRRPSRTASCLVAFRVCNEVLQVLAGKILARDQTTGCSAMSATAQNRSTPSYGGC